MFKECPEILVNKTQKICVGLVTFAIIKQNHGLHLGLNVLRENYIYLP